MLLIYFCWQSYVYLTYIESVIIKSTGQANKFGDLTQARLGLGAGSSPTRAVFGGGSESPLNNLLLIDFIEIETGGTAVKFGELSVGRHYVSGISNSTRALFAGGVTPTTVNTIDFITIATTGNATDFGDMTVAARGLMEGSATTKTRGLLISGKHDSGYYNCLLYTSDAADE